MPIAPFASQHQLPHDLPTRFRISSRSNSRHSRRSSRKNRVIIGDCHKILDFWALFQAIANSALYLGGIQNLSFGFLNQTKVKTGQNVGVLGSCDANLHSESCFPTKLTAKWTKTGRTGYQIIQRSTESEIFHPDNSLQRPMEYNSEFAYSMHRRVSSPFFYALPSYDDY